MSAVDQHAEAHRLRAELGYGARRIATELGISRHAATQLLARPLPQPVAEAADTVQPVAEPFGQPPADVAEHVAEAVQPVAGLVAARPLPRRVTDHQLVIDLRRWPTLRRALAVLEEGTGLSREAVINQAAVVLEFGYKQGTASGRIRPGHPFVVRDMTVGPPLPGRLVPRRPAVMTAAPAPPAGAD